jgi:pyridoxine 4-dehydrogenase
MLTGKYREGRLPPGPRGLLFRQILPGIEPLLDIMRQIAARRRKTVSQVSPEP